jgi:FkbM family methyltransferase
VLWPDCRIVAFEPLPGPANMYRKLFAPDPLVQLYQCAIGEGNGTRNMHVSMRDDSSSLLPITARQVAFAPGTEEVSTQIVDLATLRSLIEPSKILHPALLKIDVQGYEKHVLAGCQDLLSCFEYIYCEMSFRELYKGQPLSHSIIHWLDERGFCLEAVNHVSFDQKNIPVQADFLFLRRH